MKVAVLKRLRLLLVFKELELGCTLVYDNMDTFNISSIRNIHNEGIDLIEDTQARSKMVFASECGNPHQLDGTANWSLRTRKII